MMGQARVQPGVPAGGEYAAVSHGESPVALGAPVTAPQEPNLHGPVPAPLASQKYLDGTRIPAGASFDKAYEEFFRPLEEFESVHGDWKTTRAPSEDVLLELAGVEKAKLGSVRGVFLEANEATGEPLVEVHTRNPGYCLQNDCAGTCEACLEDDIHTLPGFIRTVTDEEGDVGHFFRTTDPAAAARYLADKKTREMLNHRLYAREAITSGKQPPWAILTPVREGEERQQLGINLSYARSMAARKNGDEQYARELLDLVQTGAPLRKDTRYTGALIDTAGYEIYGEAVKKHTAEAVRLRTAGAVLAEERKLPLPPAISAIAAAEAEGLEKAIAQEDAKVEDSRARLAKSTRSIHLWANHLLQECAKLNGAVHSAEADIAEFEWSSSWPGDTKDCPPRPAAK